MRLFVVDGIVDVIAADRTHRIAMKRHSRVVVRSRECATGLERGIEVSPEILVCFL